MPKFHRLFKDAILSYKKNTLKNSLATIPYIILSLLSVVWIIFFLVNYPFKDVTVGVMLGSFRFAMVAIIRNFPILIVFIHICGVLAILLWFIVGIMYNRFLYLKLNGQETKSNADIFMPFSILISAFITDIFLVVVTFVGSLFLIVPGVILNVRYKFVRLSIISREKSSFSKLMEVPNAFAYSASIVSSKIVISTFLHLLYICLIRNSAILILAFFVFILSIFIPALLGGGVLSIVLWAIIIIWYLVFMPIGTYMYILFYKHLSENSNNNNLENNSNSNVDEDTENNTSKLDESNATL